LPKQKKRAIPDVKQKLRRPSVTWSGNGYLYIAVTDTIRTHLNIIYRVDMAIEIETIEGAALLAKNAGLKTAVAKTGIFALPKGASALAAGLGGGLLIGMAIATLGMIAISYLTDAAEDGDSQ
jgi:hypothetical protein